MKKEILFCLLAIILFNQSALCGRGFAPLKPKQIRLDTKTKWEVKPSFMLDTLCFLNVLTGDPFYLRFYKNEYDVFEPQLTPAARLALANLKRKIKDDNKDIISASLTLYFSVTRDQNLDDLLKTVKDSREMKQKLKRTVYYTDEKWQMYESVRDDLRVIFSFLKDIHFEDYWKQNYLPNIERKIAQIKPDLPKYNVVSEVENLLGYRLSSNKITAYILHFPKPHGIRVTGLRFIMSDSDPFKTTVFIAVHESMHPPFDLKRDAELKNALDTLRADEFLMDKVKNHNPSLGYNTFEGLVEEDCVQSLDQIISEKLGVEIMEAHKRWKHYDEGIHVLAVALYSLMKQENFDGRHEKFREFLLRMLRSGKLSAGKIKPLYDDFYSSKI
ncbi:MAG: hypothetical protein ACR2N3_00230 [Pyrinomonadaceae bacterium]